MTDSRETLRRKQFRDHLAAASADQAAASNGRFTAYTCPTCKRARQTTANQPPERCPVCILDRR